MLAKIEKYLFYLLLFAIPLQTRKLLFQQEWYFSEWQSVWLYASDLVIIILFIFWFFNFKLKIDKHDYFLLAFVAISAISIVNSTSVQLSLLSFVKLLEFVIFYFYIKSYAIYKFGFSGSLLALIAGGLFQAAIAIGQFIKQSDLGLRYLGESVLAPYVTGVASFFNLAGDKIIRAYGTTPHPNILAAYLLLSIFAFYFIYIYSHKFSRTTHYTLLATYTALLFGLFFTFSRVIIFILVLNFILRFILTTSVARFRKEFTRRRIVTLVTVTVIFIGVFSFLYWPEVVSRVTISSQEEAVRLRIFYNAESLKSGFNLFGVGIGNFVNWLRSIDPNLSRHLYQPVHNIYLLIYAETGILGISSFLLFIIFLIKDFIGRTKLKRLYHYSFLLVFLSFLFIGLFDHFLWTLQEGRLVFWLTLGLISSHTLGAGPKPESNLEAKK